MDSELSFLQIDKLTKSFAPPKKVLEGIQLSVKKGEIVALAGESGSGKTTLIRLISGLLRPDEGEIYLNGRCLNKNNFALEASERKISLVFQDNSLFPHLNVRDNLLFGISKSVKNRDHLCSRLLELLGLEGMEKRYPHELSGGQQQRIGLARALAVEPDLLLMDEPFSSLDRAKKREIIPELLRILRFSSTTTIFVSHDEEEALAMADRIVFLRRGQIIRSGSPQELYEAPFDKNIAEYFGTLSLFPLHKIEKTDHHWHAETALGALSLGEEKWQSLPGAELPRFAAFRPEDIYLRQEPNSAAASFACRVDTVRFGLPQTLAQVVLETPIDGCRHVQVAVKSKNQPNLKARYFLEFDSDKALLLA